jgi:Flp pilus assembly protein protease CpaA
MKPHRGTLILVLGILGLVLCGPLGIAAWVMGNGDMKEMDAGAMDPSGRSTTNAGRICGIIATILLAISIVVCILLFALGMFGAVASHH